MKGGTNQLGLGLIGIGRSWGAVDAVVPSASEAMRLLERAVELGITFFDTAPAYGLSEERLGMFLACLRPQERKRLTIATKFGEHWNAEDGSAYVDHSREAPASRSSSTALSTWARCLRRSGLMSRFTVIGGASLPFA